jgi:hypothetical protein
VVSQAEGEELMLTKGHSVSGTARTATPGGTARAGFPTAAVAAFAMLLAAAGTCSAISQGDITLIGWNADTNDEVVILACTNILGGTQVFLRDDEWDGSTFPDINEGTLAWTVPTGGVSAGTVIVINSTPSASTGSVEESNSGFDTGTSGDQIWIYAGTNWNAGSFTFLLAFETASSTFGGNTNGTGLAAESVFAWGNKDNWRYERSVTNGTAAEIRAAIRTSGNWTNSDGTGDQSFIFGTAPFTITDVMAAESDIVRVDSEPEDIAYANYQESADLTAGNSPVVYQMLLRDGGADGLDNDLSPTILTNIAFSVLNPGFLRRAALYSGGVELQEVAVSGSPIAFDNITVVAADDSTTDLVLRVSFTTNVVDNQFIRFSNVVAVAACTGSVFAAAGGGGAVSSTNGNDNRIEVTADRLVFDFVDANVCLTNRFRASVRGADPNGNRDLDCSTTVFIWKVEGSGTLSGGDATALVGGTNSWTSLRITASGAFRISAADGSLMSATSGVMNAFIGLQDFEGTGEENWSYTATPGGGAIAASTDRAYSGSTCLRLTGTDHLNADPFVTFAGMDIEPFKDCALSIAFSASGVDSPDRLTLDVSYDGGVSWTGSGSTNLVKGYNDLDLAFGATTNGPGPLTVSANPWTVSLPSAATQVHVRVKFDEDSGGNQTDEHCYIDRLVLSGVYRDMNSTVDEPGSQVAATALPALADTVEEAVDVFRFTVRDIGATDGDPTSVTKVTLRPAGANTADWSDTIAGVLLNAGGEVNISTQTISDSAVVISVAAGALDIPDGDSRDVTCSVYFRTNGIMDGTALCVMIDADSHGFEAQNEGSRFAGTFVFDVVSAIHRIEVDATSLAFDSVAPPSGTGVGTPFRVRVSAIDVNGNTDTNASQVVELAASLGSGILYSPSGLSAALIRGTQMWESVSYNTNGIFRLTASAAGLASTSRDMRAGEAWINEFDYDTPGTSSDTNEWVEIVGPSGMRLHGLELAVIRSDGTTAGLYDLDGANWTFADETNGFGFFVVGIVQPSLGVADFKPSNWSVNELLNSDSVSIQLRRKAGAGNVHLVDYCGNNPETAEDQATTLADSNDAANTNTSLFLSMGTGTWFTAFTWTNTVRQATPGQINPGQCFAEFAGGRPAVRNDGASEITTAGARLSGTLLAGHPSPEFAIFWGPSDGGTSPAAWSNRLDFGAPWWGSFTTNLTLLDAGSAYHYRCFASNASGIAWATGTVHFTTLAAGTLPSAGLLHIDNIGVTRTSPLSSDADADGMSDAWERTYFGDESVSGGLESDDQDHDGWTDMEEFLAGTNPTNANSLLRIVTADIASPESDDIVIRVEGGNFNGQTDLGAAGDNVRRMVRILAADSATNAKSLRASVIDDLSGTNTWTDVGAVSGSRSRFYSVSVSYGGSSCTNVEEWAMHVQPRQAGGRYLVCVPVSLGSAAENNLDSTAGSQLARGLHAGEAGNADRIQYVTESGTWEEALLVTNAQGDVYWWANGSPADVTLFPGMPLWVIRGQNAASRTNTVFVGRSFAGSDAVDFTFSTNWGGWNAFGWCLPRPRQHRNQGEATPAGQLGFWGKGTGGTHPETASKKGDQIWVWEDNTWRHFYWMIDTHGGAGSEHNGRWWDSWRGTYADFALEPGCAYYYFHTTNWGAANFTWRPENP